MAVQAVAPGLFTVPKIIGAVFLISLLFACGAEAGNLTTFADYAAMTDQEKSAVRSRAAEIFYKAAGKRGDRQQLRCLGKTYLNGPEAEVRLAHEELRHMLAVSGFHDANSRVEYAIEDHFNTVCPPAGVKAKKDNLTTFAEYAAMTPEQRNIVWGRAGAAIYGQAARENDEKRKHCLREKFIDGPDKEVRMEHIKLMGKIKAEIEIEREAETPNPNKRAEYLIANHMKKACPRSVTANRDPSKSLAK